LLASRLEIRERVGLRDLLSDGRHGVYGADRDDIGSRLSRRGDLGFEPETALGDIVD